MVQIRKLAPIVKIHQPRPKNRMATRVTVVRRTNRDFPPPTPQPTPCRLWQGTQGSDGYGWRKIYQPDGTRKSVSMHRWAMEQAVGHKLRSSQVVLHACDNPLCYRVDHLSIGTIADNNADMRAKGRDSKPPRNVFHGEDHPMAKLNRRQVRSIREYYRDGLSIRSIAEEFGVSRSAISRIVKGVTWATGPQRDLLAEARQRLANTAPEEAATPPRKRTRAVKPLTLTRRSDEAMGAADAVQRDVDVDDA